MKTILFLFAIIGASLCKDERAQWEEWKTANHKSFSGQEDEDRFNNFKQNLKIIKEHNEKYEAKQVTYALKATRFAHMNDQEYLDLFKRSSARSQPLEHYSVKDLSWEDHDDIPESYDWRTQGVVTPVKDQHFDRCGSCWSFAATGVLEAYYKLKTGKLVSFSEQYLMDCDTKINCGCKGGLEGLALNYVKKHGIPTEEDYPYKGKNGECNKNVTVIDVNIKEVKNSSCDEGTLKALIARKGPIAVALDSRPMQLYSHGIFYNESCDASKAQQNHALLLVGYGTENGTDYWILKNSFGPNHGVDGYLYLKRGINHCKVGDTCVFPVL